MKVKQLALCFVFLLSSQYVLGVAAQTGSAQKRVASKRMPANSINCASSSGCIVKSDLANRLDQSFENVRDNLPDTISINRTIEENLHVNGSATGFKSFRIVGPYTCACGNGEFAKVFVNISFVHVLLDFVLYLLESLLGGLLGPLGRALAIILGDVVELLVRVLGLNIEVQLSVHQDFVPGANPYIENFAIADVSDITLLGLNLSFLANLLSPILTPVLNLVLEIMLEGPVKAEFDRELEKLVIVQDDFICPQNSTSSM